MFSGNSLCKKSQISTFLIVPEAMENIITAAVNLFTTIVASDWLKETGHFMKRWGPLFFYYAALLHYGFQASKNGKNCYFLMRKYCICSNQKIKHKKGNQNLLFLTSMLVLSQLIVYFTPKHNGTKERQIKKWFR